MRPFYILLLSFSLISCSIHNNSLDENIKSDKTNSIKAEENRKIISGFYTAFQNNDATQMAKYYHDNIEFEDPAFGKLNGDRAKYMWKMLVDKAQGKLKITFGNIQADENSGRAEWEALYRFELTGRKVHNKIKANFEFKEGKIYKHKDVFDLWAWSKMAFGFTGWVLGFTSFFKNKLNEETNKQLNLYIEKEKKK